MSDDTIIEPIKIPGMQVTFQSPLSPDGKGINFVLACDALINPKALDERLDVIAAAARRQAAFEELPIVKQSLYANRRLLETARKERAKQAAALHHKLELVQAGRRGQADPTKHAPQDVNALAQHDNRILQIEGQIEGASARLPYLQAIIEGRDPPELFPDEGQPERDAAD